MTRYARKVDKTQAEIAEAVRKAGWLVWCIEEPCDLLCYHVDRDIWRTLECKTPNRKDGTYRQRADQAQQNIFCTITRTPRVTSAETALEALA
jgi:hypothetical protein